MGERPAFGQPAPKRDRRRRRPQAVTDAADLGKKEQAHKERRRRNETYPTCPRCGKQDWSLTGWDPETRTWMCDRCATEARLPGLYGAVLPGATDTGEPNESGRRFAPFWRGFW